MAGTPPLPLPAVPATLRTPHARAAYLLEHFWDAMDFGDTLRSRDERFVEQSLVDFLSLFPHADTAALRAAVQRLVRRAGADAEACLLVLRLAEKVPLHPRLADAVRGVFHPFPRSMGPHARHRRRRKIRPALLLEAALKTARAARPPTCASAHARGRAGHVAWHRVRTAAPPVLQSRLHALHRKRSACSTATRHSAPQCAPDASASRRSVRARSARRGERTKEELPKGWIAGYAAEELAETEAYVLPEMPTIYLLDRDKRVLLKEATPHDVLRRVESEASGR